ncbi:hypothetical protein B0T21DRAFT_353200 [Apiosordaria backusii]|uniref:Uncharacterized protein n=1 Tax=Apiosordaria backusii TaxID=314023 RepID=A0AA39ZV59_9PEZI|nr:hypothetical protein B0T21DRAFT_353200 [Apiosordaria backusii]
MCEIQERHDKRCGHLVEIHRETCEDECGNWGFLRNWHTTLVLCKKPECVKMRKETRKNTRAEQKRAALMSSTPHNPKIQDQESRSDDPNMEEPKAEKTSMQMPPSSTTAKDKGKKRDFWSIIS